MKLSTFTTFKIGGPAKVFVRASTGPDLANSVRQAKKDEIPFFILGGGSNILVSDKGFDGLVIKNEYQDLKISSRGKDTLRARVSSGFPLQRLIQTLFDEGSGVLWKFAGIPGTVGGAVASNAHGGDLLFNTFVKETIFDESGSVILEAILELPKSSNLGEDRRSYLRWLKEKSVKFPKEPSAGCVFKNLSVDDQKRLGLPTNSTGYFIDKILKLGGRQIGRAKISEKHANFIVNTSNAKAKDVLALMNLIKEKASGFDVKLEEEIKLVGV